MKKLAALGVALVSLFFLTGFNYSFIDTTFSFDYAIIQLPNGEVVEGEVEKWKDYEGEQLQITLKGGDTYLTSSFNAVLIAE